MMVDDLLALKLIFTSSSQNRQEECKRAILLHVKGSTLQRELFPTKHVKKMDSTSDKCILQILFQSKSDSRDGYDH